jgi:hypothetical protein
LEYQTKNKPIRIELARLWFVLSQGREKPSEQEYI